MKAKLTQEEFDKLANKELKAEYNETDGVYILKVEAVDGLVLENVDALKKTVTTLRGEKKDLVAKVEAYKEGDGFLDPVKAREALTKVGEFQNWTPDKKVQELVAAREAAISEQLGTKIKQLDQELVLTRSQLEEQLVDTAAISAISAAKASVKLLFPHVKSRIKVERNTAGKYVAQVLDDDGSPAMTKKTGSMDPMSLEELVETFRADSELAAAFQGAGASGSGAQGAGSGSRTGSPRSISSRDMAALSGVPLEDIASGKVTVTLD